MSSYASSIDYLVENTNCGNVYDLLDQLCQQHLGTGRNHREMLQDVAKYFSNCRVSLNRTLPYDEGTITTIITQHLNETRPLTKGGRAAATDTVELFSNMHDELKSTQLDTRKRTALLTFLYIMADKTNSNGFQKFMCRNNSLHTLFKRQTSAVASSSSTSVTSDAAAPRHISMTAALNCLSPRIPQVSTSTSTSSILTTGSALYKDGSRCDLKYHRSASTLGDGMSSQPGHHLANYKKTTSLSDSDSEESYKFQDDIVQNVLYSFTGIQGKYLRKDVTTGRFKLDNTDRTLDVVQAGMLLRLSELGYYHDVVKSYTDPNSGLCAVGLMGQGFISALKTELTKYYGMVALLQEQINQQHMTPLMAAYNNNNNINYNYNNNYNRNALVMRSSSVRAAPPERLTLLKVLVWYVEPLHRLQWLARVGEACAGQKGGALASTINSFLSKGDPAVQRLTKELLLSVCRPMYQMLTRWMLDGEISDTHDEFFIEALHDVTKQRLWQDKYRVRTTMLPQFISNEMAKKILVTGKSINFLGDLCDGKQAIPGRDELLACIDENGEDIFSSVSDTKLHTAIETVYLCTSKCVLDIVVGHHRLLEHLHGMRRYLLLGQGDFVGLLMENLKAELDKPARDVLTYDLQSTMDTAIRATNAQYEDHDILNHLDLRMLPALDGEIGWDILSLQYNVDGPLSAMLEPCVEAYQSLFKPLWRMKHMEYVLSSKIWKNQMGNAKPLRCMDKELKTILYTLYLFTSEIVHFTHQMQYYILFEVIECSWVEFQEQMQHAKSLDDILHWHNEFLRTIKVGAFLEPGAVQLFSNMEAVYDGIVTLDNWQDAFYEKCFAELNARKSFDEEKIASEKAGKFGVTAERQMVRDQEHKIFEQTLAVQKLELERYRAKHEMSVRSFLMALNSNDDPNLQLFGIRLDFNEYYKKRDQRLGVPLTFQHMRYSNVFYSTTNKSLLGSRYSNFN